MPSAAPFLNAAQKSVIATYENGEFSELLDSESEEEFQKTLDSCGDTLFKFLMIELSSKEDCDSTETAYQRMSTVIQQVESVTQAIAALPDETFTDTASEAPTPAG